MIFWNGWYQNVRKSVKKEQFRSWPYRKHTISKQLGVIIFERPGDAMSYFSTEEVDNLKSLRAMVTEDLINETDYEDAKGTILAVAKKRRLSAAPKASADSRSRLVIGWCNTR